MLSKLRSVFAESNNRKKKRLGLNNGFDLLSNIVDDCAVFFSFLGEWKRTKLCSTEIDVNK